MPNEINHQTLVLTLIAAIVISLGGTVVILTKLSSIGGVGTITGMAQTSEAGQVQINISKILSIDVTNNFIDFGRCAPVPGGHFASIASNMTEAQINATWTNCSGSVSGLPAYIRVVNDGTMEALVNVSTDRLGSDLLNTPYGYFSYRTVNGSTQGGCAPVNTSQTWINFTQIDPFKYTVCKDLNYGAYERHVDFYANLSFDSTAYTAGAQNITVTFWATTP